MHSTEHMTRHGNSIKDSATRLFIPPTSASWHTNMTINKHSRRLAAIRMSVLLIPDIDRFGEGWLRHGTVSVSCPRATKVAPTSRSAQSQTAVSFQIWATSIGQLIDTDRFHCY